MKKLLLLIILIAGSKCFFAQVSKGNWLAGGFITFQSTHYTAGDDHSTVFTFKPDAGYFFIDRLAAGLRTSVTYVNNRGDSFRDLLIGPFARYYFLRTTQHTNIFLEGNFMTGSEKYENFEAENKTRFGFAAGPVFFINPSIAVEAMLEWQTIKHSGTEGRYNTFGIGIGFQVHLKSLKAKQGK